MTATTLGAFHLGSHLRREGEREREGGLERGRYGGGERERERDGGMYALLKCFTTVANGYFPRECNNLQW